MNLTNKYGLAADKIDVAASKSERNGPLQMLERQNRMIHNIRKPLKRIENGIHGICRVRREDITTSRLKARPEAFALHPVQAEN